MIKFILILFGVSILYLLIGKFMRALHSDIMSIKDRLNRIEDALLSKGIKINREKNWTPSLNFFMDFNNKWENDKNIHESLTKKHKKNKN